MRKLDQTLFTILYCATHRRCRSGAAVSYLSHKISCDDDVPYNTPLQRGIKQLPNRKADAVTEAISKACAPLKTFLKTMTADHGKEFAGHKNIAETLGLGVYFAKPYHSWERGLNAHTNGLVRQYLPKETAFDTVTHDEVRRIQNLLNNRPRKILGFRTPLEASQDILGTQPNFALHT